MDASLRRSSALRRSRPIARHSVGSALLLIVGLVPLLQADRAGAADLRTTNFIVMAPTPDLARAVGDAAEGFRRDLAIYWLGSELPPWPNPCPVRVVAGSNLAAQGVTTYNRSPVRDFQMEVIGSPERILDSVLPHEVTHTILATYFGRPLPRWADEGICTTVEHASERQKHESKLREFLRSRRGIAMNKLFLMTEYPSDVLPMYAQGYSVCQFLIAQQGARGFVEFLGDYMQKPSWTHHVRSHYGYESLAELQEAWLAWVAEGGGPVDAYVKQPAVSPQAQVAAVPPAQRPAASGLQPIDSLAAAPSAIALASATERDAGSRDAGSQAGWYSRLRQQTLGGPGGSAGGRSPAPRPTAEPPSLHSVSQPQPEQGLAPGGLVPGQSTPHPPVAAERDGYRPGSLSTSGSYWR